MALKTCWECGEKVSEHAQICPHCGVRDPAFGGPMVGVPAPTIKPPSKEWWAGKECPYCQTHLVAGDEVTVCRSCHQPHHSDCWRDNGGCAVFSCGRGVDLTEDLADLLPPLDLTAPEPLPAGKRPARPQEARPRHHPGEEIIGPDGGIYVWVPPGEFMMGCPPDPSHLYDFLHVK